MIGRRDFFFFHACFTYVHTHSATPLFLPSSSVSLSYLIFAVLMRECWRKHLCMSSTFPITILNGSCHFPTVHYKCAFCIRSEKVEMLMH